MKPRWNLDNALLSTPHHPPRHVMLRRFILFIFALCLTASAHAITIVGYNPDLHDRFDSGFPSAPVINSSAGPLRRATTSRESAGTRLCPPARSP
ncbi:hypothetical protein [Verrucomicrobium spinosum]|uniref:hypothetical protein n=1 Tax=Verrucomicrobium spinosum TaxID=2736 RepID=UPI000AD64D86|nr:hypothetical protein [Verrucomicrobium spinosum]